MRKLLVIAASTLLLTAGAAFAQDDAEDVVIEAEPSLSYNTDNYVGVTLGYPFALNFGFEDLLSEGADLRLQVTSYFFNASFGADALFDVAEIEDAIQIYAGGGVALGTSFVGVFNATPSVVAGGEYRFNEELGLFLEFGLGYTIGFPYPFSPRGGLGVNYHF